MTYKRAAACVSQQAHDEAFPDGTYQQNNTAEQAVDEALQALIDVISKTILQSSPCKPHFASTVTTPQASVCTPAHIHEFALTTHVPTHTKCSIDFT